MKILNTTLTLAVCVLFTGLMYGQTVFGPQQVIAQNVVDEPDIIAIEDVNKDGYNDLLVIRRTTGKVFLYLNDGIGNFNNNYIVADNANIFSIDNFGVTLADINNDTYLDLVYSTTTINKIVWKENDGNGNFGYQKTISNSSTSYGLTYVFDFNNDGWVDIVSVSSANNTLNFFANDGAGIFSQTQTVIFNYPIGNKKLSIKDLNGDGNMDIIIEFLNEHTLAWYENDGIGNFTLYLLQIPALDNVFQLIPIDFNVDGYMDLFAVYLYPARLFLYINEGDNTFSTAQVIEDYPSIFLYGIQLHDFNGDGLIDICAFNVDENTISWFENLGSGNIGSKQIIDIDFWFSAFVLDADGDGDLDIANKLENSSEVKLSLNDGLGNFSSITLLASEGTNYLERVLASDLNGISGNELIFVKPLANELFWRRPEDGEDNPANYITAFAFSNITSVSTADLNNNGTSDLLLTSYQNSKVCYFENVGEGEFNFLQVISDTYGEPTSSIFLDYDNDGDMDILVSSALMFGIVWFENDGTGSFSEKQVIAQNIVGDDLKHEDIDGDGLKDIVLRKYNGYSSYYSLVWFKNLGTGYENMQTISTLYLYNHPYCIGDINHDGYLDIIAFVESENSIKWRRNMGSGIFASWQTLLTAIDSLSTMTMADIDRNGTLDLVTANFENPKITWFSNDGTGYLANENTIYTTSATDIFDINIIDLDNDSYPDLVVGKLWGLSSGQIVWLKNQQNGIFEAEQNITYYAGYGKFIHIEDLDNDSDWDILLVQDNNKVTWHENLLETVVSVSTMQGISTNTLHITPNPTRYTATITYTTQQAQPTILNLFDLTSRLLHKETLQATLGTNNYVIDMTKYPNGMYVVTLNNGIEVVSGKVVKE